MDLEWYSNHSEKSQSGDICGQEVFMGVCNSTKYLKNHLRKKHPVEFIEIADTIIQA